MQLSLSEILKLAGEQPTAEERRQVLYKHNSPALQALLKYALDPKVKFLLPEGTPPYKASDSIESHGMLYTNLRKMYLFIEGGREHPLSQVKREQLFIELLESLDKDDAALVCAVKDKYIPYTGINKKFVRKTFPGLLNDDPEKVVEETTDEQDVSKTE